MTAEVYQRAKAIFSELVDAPESQRAARLHELRQQAPEIEKEVRSLLDYHTAQSLVAQQAVPKIRTRSTLHTTYQPSGRWWVPLIIQSLAIAAPLLVIAWLISAWTSQAIRQSLNSAISARLSASVDSRLGEFRVWESEQLQLATDLAKRSEVVEPIAQLVKLANDSSQDESDLSKVLADSPLADQLTQELEAVVGVPVKFAVWNRRMLLVADWRQSEQTEHLGDYVTPAGAAVLAPVLKGKPRLCLPSLGSLMSEPFETQADEPIVLVPVADSSGTPVAALMLHGYGLETQYAALLTQWQGDSQAETYLINSRGTMLTRSRYETQLSSMPVARDGPETRGMVFVRDPGVNLLEGEATQVNAAAWPPTLLARELTAGGEGVYVDGYSNYVGEKVVGAWKWIPEQDLGIAVEERYADAFAIMGIANRGFWILGAAFALGVAGLVVTSVFSRFQRKRLRDISEVGPYQIQELLGEGGMGRVYLAEHALLCRQSAIKVLTKGATDLSNLSRFEREVQLASQLTHPNTIAIYDFGRNQDGIFYYAMEYINGAHLGQVIEFGGPIAPGRCIYILQQLCRALNEAHQAGVVHRDIKPQNIMICNRGGEPDFVKLFDYGLVKAFAPGVSHTTSQTKIVVGTPRFMAPERLESPWLADPRVDIYSVGALAYYLLTGKLPPLVTLGSQMEHEQPGIETLDLPPSVVEFGGILSICLSVEPASRPSSMVSLMRELDQLADKFPWSREDSIEWWTKNENKLLHLVQTKRKKLLPRPGVV